MAKKIQAYIRLQVPAGDAKAIADAMAEFRADPDRAHALAMRHRDEIKPRFSAEAMAERITAFYGDLVPRPEPDRSGGAFQPFEDRA